MYTSGDYFEMNPTWHVEDSAWKAQQILKILGRNQISPLSIADLGCGAGEVLHQVGLSIEGIVNLHGYDISPKAIELAKTRQGGNLEFFQEDFQIKKGRMYDLLLMIDVIEHIEDYFGFLRNVKSKGEYKILHIPLELSVYSIFRETPLLYNRLTLGHIHFFSKLQALQMLKELDYEIIDFFFTKPILELPQPTLLAKLSKGPIWILSNINEDFTARLFGGFSLMVLAR